MTGLTGSEPQAFGISGFPHQKNRHRACNFFFVFACASRRLTFAGEIQTANREIRLIIATRAFILGFVLKIK